MYNILSLFNDRHVGPLGHLFVSKEHRDKGIAGILMAAMFKHISKLNEDPIGFIHQSNKAALKSALKLGSIIANEQHFIINMEICD